MKIILAGLILLSAFTVNAATNAAPTVGSTYEEVIRSLGEPNINAASGGNRIMMYDLAEFSLQSNVVVTAYYYTREELARKLIAKVESARIAKQQRNSGQPSALERQLEYERRSALEHRRRFAKEQAERDERLRYELRVQEVGKQQANEERRVRNLAKKFVQGGMRQGEAEAKALEIVRLEELERRVEAAESAALSAKLAADEAMLDSFND